MGGISTIGIGSGLDGNALVQRLVNAERAGPESRLNRREASLQAELSALGLVRSAVSDLGSALGAFEGLGDARKVSVSDESLFTATAKDGAPAGNYAVTVSQLARAQSIASNAFGSTTDVVGTGTLTIAVGAAAPVEVAIEAGAATLQDVATSINEAGAGVTAAVINDGTGERLVLAAEATGAANTISITVADDDGTNGDASGLSRLAYPSGSGAMTELVAPLDAELNVNGLAVTRPSNEIDDLLPDVTLSLQGADPGRSVSVGVETDLAQVRSAVQSFVKSYNALTDQVKKVSSYNAEAQTGGPLVGDSTIRGLMSELRSGLIGGLVDGGTFTRLVEIGIRTSEGGGLEIDDEALTAALESDLPAVNELLAGAGERFGALVDRYSGSDGRFAARTDGIDARLEDIADRREALARRLAQVEARYRREFGALDTLIANLASTGDFLSSQLANLPRIQGPRS